MTASAAHEPTRAAAQGPTGVRGDKPGDVTRIAADLMLISRISMSGTSVGELIQKAGEIDDVQDWRDRAPIAVGVWISGGEAVQEAREVQDVEDRRYGAVVAVGVARSRRHASPPHEVPGGEVPGFSERAADVHGGFVA